MPRKLSLSRSRNQISALSSQIVRVPSRLPVRPDHALPMQSDDQCVLYRCDGTPYSIARDRGRSCEEIAFAELQTGGIVEIVRDPRDAQHTQLAVWSNDEVELVDFFRTGDRILIPPQRHDHILRYLVLPSGAAPYKSVRHLAHEIRRAIRSCVRVLNPYASLLAAWVVYSWVADCLAVAVHLCICGLPESGKTTLLELLRLFCRRSLLITDISAAGFYEACSLVSPTLMIDEAELDQRSSSQPVRRLLRAATNRNHSIMRKGSSWDVFGPKIICSENPPDDPALLSRCLVVRMVEEDTSGLKKPSDPELVALSLELQKQLLYFRLKNYKTIHAPQVPGAERLHPRLRDLVTTVAAAFRDDPEWPALILQCCEVTGQAVTPSLAPPEAAVLDGLWAGTHRRTGWECFVFNADLVSLISEIYKAAGQEIFLTPVSVGKILKKFGIDSGVHRNTGNGIWISNKNRHRIHELVEKYGLTLPSGTLVGSSPVQCWICESVQEDSAMLGDEDGVSP